jgi:two-component system NtrC family sensor kinase
MSVFETPSASESASAKRPPTVGLDAPSAEVAAAEIAAADVERLVRARSFELIAALASKLAHEIKNPLAGIYGAANVLAHQMSGEDPRREVLEGIRREVLRLDEVVMELVDFARAPTVRESPTGLRNFVEEVAAPFRARLASRGVTVEVGVDERLTVAVDSRLMAQVLRNLLSNASQALAGDTGWIRVEAHATAEHVELCVLDSGAGFAPDVLPHVFEPFFSTRSRGVGLGLTIVRQNLEAHGGTARAQNGAHGGACVCVTLPFANPSAPSADPSAPIADPSTPPAD